MTFVTTHKLNDMKSGEYPYTMSFDPNIGGGTAASGIPLSQFSSLTGVDGAIGVCDCLLRDAFNLVDDREPVAGVSYCK